jgi:hypothetical protein
MGSAAPRLGLRTDPLVRTRLQSRENDTRQEFVPGAALKHSAAHRAPATQKGSDSGVAKWEQMRGWTAERLRNPHKIAIYGGSLFSRSLTVSAGKL